MADKHQQLIEEIGQAVSDAKEVKVERSQFGYEIDHGRRLAKFSGVTGVLRGIPKPALVGWGINQVANYALKNLDSWKDLPKRDALKLLKGSPYTFTQSRADRGHNIHNAIEAISRGTGMPDDLTDDERCCVEGAQELMVARDNKTLASEVMGFNVDHGYAGTFDHWEIDKRTGVTWLLDWKSSKFIYPEQSVQMVAYQNFTHVLLGADIQRSDKEDSYNIVATGKLVPWKPEYAQRLGVVHVEPHESTLHAVQQEIHGYLFDVFLAAKFIKEHMDNVDTWKKKEPKVKVYDKPITYGEKIDAK